MLRLDRHVNDVAEDRPSAASYPLSVENVTSARVPASGKATMPHPGDRQRDALHTLLTHTGGLHPRRAQRIVTDLDAAVDRTR